MLIEVKSCRYHDRNASVTVLLLLPVIVTASQPNIVFVVADDLGWADVGWHNSSVFTPNLTTMAEAGIILNRSYVSPTCTPSRAAFLTGLYSHKTGLQHGPLGDLEPVGLPTDLPTVAERLQSAGYSTHLVGKWHLGFCDRRYLPTRRGFHSFYGYLTGMETHFTHESYTLTKPFVKGFDFWDQEVSAYDQKGIYSTHSFARRVSEIISQQDKTLPFFLYYSMQTVHTPLEVPEYYTTRYRHVSDSHRRKYLGLVSAMDEAFGRLIEDLRRSDLLKDTLIVFTSDNGGVPGVGGASNAPLSGAKDTLWDGGVRVPGFIYSERLGRSGYVEDGLVHATDWSATFLDLAGLPVSDINLDGVSQVKSLLRGSGSSRTELVVSLDEKECNGAYIEFPYKLILGDPVYKRDWRQSASPLMPSKDKVRLFNIFDDPSETHDIKTLYPSVTRRIIAKLLSHLRTVRFSGDGRSDVAGRPDKWGGVWSPGWCKPDRGNCVNPGRHCLLFSPFVFSFSN